MTVNEVSRRYVTDAPEFDLPSTWRMSPEPGKSKQGSGRAFDASTSEWISADVIRLADQCRDLYVALVERGVAPEQARLVLPMALVTEWIWTGSLYAFARICRERLAPDAQPETRAVAEGIAAAMATAFPVSWPAIMEVGNDD